MADPSGNIMDKIVPARNGILLFLLIALLELPWVLPISTAGSRNMPTGFQSCRFPQNPLLSCAGGNQSWVFPISKSKPSLPLPHYVQLRAPGERGCWSERGTEGSLSEQLLQDWTGLREPTSSET